MEFAVAVEAIPSNPGKIAAVTNAVASLDTQGWTWFGLASEGGGRRNEMAICNALDHNMELEKYYMGWGNVKVAPEPLIQAKTNDYALFHNAGSWAATGSSGIITYKLQHDTFLHIMWDCPFNFFYSDNFVGLMLTSDSKLKNPNYDSLFNNMYQYKDWTNLNLGKPEANSYFDLVCCGPSTGNSHEKNGTEPWGFRRPCKVKDGHYAVMATMGDRHATSSKIIVVKDPNSSSPRSAPPSAPSPKPIIPISIIGENKNLKLDSCAAVDPITINRQTNGIEQL